jgi:hypothetical protein
LQVALVGGGLASSGSTTASNDGTTETLTGTQFPPVSVLGAQTVMTGGTLAQVSRAFDDGSAGACAGVGGAGATFTVDTSGACTVTPSAPVSLNLGVIGLATLSLRADAISGACTATSTTASGSATLTNASIVSTVLGIDTTLLTLPTTPTANTGLAIPGVLDVTLNEQSSSGPNQISVTALTLTPLAGSLAGVTNGTVTCGGGNPTPPDALELHLPAPISVDATSPSGAVVTYTATASGGGAGPHAVTCDPPSGSTFPIGGTTVACSVSDGGEPVTGSFTVTVVDTTVPVTPTTPTTPTSPSAPAASPPSSPVAARLAFTGLDVRGFLVFGVALLLAGMFLVRLARRSRDTRV